MKFSSGASWLQKARNRTTWLDEMKFKKGRYDTFTKISNMIPTISTVVVAGVILNTLKNVFKWR